MVDFVTNYIKAVPTKFRQSQALVSAYQECYHDLLNKGFWAELVKLDNKVSKELISAITSDGLNHQLASPGDHCQNPEECCIQDFKVHFISVRRCTNKDFPANCWELLIPQAEHTLNMLQLSKIKLAISAHTMPHRHHNYSANPIGPVGCHV